MSIEIKKEIQLEIAHVLFIDIVGYSKLSINDQRAAIDELTQAVRTSEQFQNAEAAARLIKIPTGDGMALVFYKSPEEPVECALEISRALKEHPKLQLRMGVHSGPVSGVIDVNGQANLAGAGLNMAQRVMDCGDAGHILLSKRVADDLGEYEQWRPLLHDLGECEVKHGMRVSIVNLHADEVGNPQLPKKFQALKKHRARMCWGVTTTALLALAAIVAGVALFSRYRVGSTVTAPEKSIAVLPFENLSDDKTNAYFADGIQDEILTKLASIADLKVISRTSTAKYKSKPEDLKTVSQQLGVANVLEGTVQRAADKVRVNVQLIDARTDSHLWARGFDGDAKDIFAVESRVAQEVADSLQAKLSPAEANTIASAPTSDPAAYDFLLKGDYERRLAQSSLKPESLDQAAAWYEQAIAHDPNLALAIARLVECRMFRHWFFEPFTDAELAEVKKLAERALALKPDLAEAHIALGSYYYYGYRQYEQALAEFARAVQLQPNNSEALQYQGFVHRRQGQWLRSLEELGRALPQDPRNASLASNYAEIFCQLREWKEAENADRHAIAIDPHEVVGMRGLLLSIVNGSGNISEALRVLAGYPSDSKLIVNSNIGFVTGVTGERAYTFVLARDFQAALKIWDKAENTAADQRRQLAARVAIRVIAGDLTGAQADAEKAQPLLEQRLREQSTDILANTELSWVYLALKRNDDAMKLAQQAVALLPPEKDAITGIYTLAGQASIASHSGAAMDAITILRRLLSIPSGSGVSIARLKVDPVWDPIRNDPAFQQLLVGKELIGPNKQSE